jgi:hypothetical protein
MSEIFGDLRLQTPTSKLATDLNREVPAGLPRKQRNWACHFDVVFMSFHVDDGRPVETHNRPQFAGNLKLTAAAWVLLRVEHVLRSMYFPSHESRGWIWPGFSQLLHFWEPSHVVPYYRMLYDGMRLKLCRLGGVTQKSPTPRGSFGWPSSDIQISAVPATLYKRHSVTQRIDRDGPPSENETNPDASVLLPVFDTVRRSCISGEYFLRQKRRLTVIKMALRRLYWARPGVRTRWHIVLSVHEIVVSPGWMRHVTLSFHIKPHLVSCVPQSRSI